MRELYEVKTKRYITYHVLANGYDEAKDKVEKKLIETNTDSILLADGSINNRFEMDEVQEIKKLGNQLIF